MDDNKRAGQLAKLIRQGKATPEQRAEYERLDATVSGASNVVGGWYDLPMAAGMWKADGANIER